MILTYNRVMSFLGNSDYEEIERLAANPMELEANLSQSYSEPEDLEPDTPEASAAAMADGQMYDRAEETIYRLMEKNPSAWETFKATVRKLSPESAVAPHLEKYSLTDHLYSGGK